MNALEHLDAISSNECFGYAPKSSSTKPAHVANGWFRRLEGTAFDAKLLNDTVVQWSGSNEVNPTNTLISQNSEVFELFDSESRHQLLTEFRSDLRLLISPYGGAVNRGNNRSSYNITHHMHLTKDFADNSIGAFLHSLTTLDLGSGPSPIATLIREILRDETDEISILTSPLTRDAIELPVTVGNYEAPSVFKIRKGEFQSGILRSLRLGFDQLAQFERRQGLGLSTLRRAVMFGVLSVLLHMANRGRELAKQKAMVPFLLYFQGKRRTTVHQGSHVTYNLARTEIENLYAARFRERIVARIGMKPTLKQCREVVKDITTGLKAEESASKEILDLFTANLKVYETVDALAEAVRDVSFKLLSGKPTDFYRALGVRSGLLKPYGNRATQKYYSLDGVLLEAVLGSVVPQGEISFRTLLDRLWSSYGFVIGGRPHDVEILLNEGVIQANPEDLKENTRQFRELLVANGWARPFADGVLMIYSPGSLLQ